MKRGIVDIRSEEGSAAERGRMVRRVESARLSAGRDSGRNLEACAWIRFLNCAAEGCDGVGDFGEARDGDASLWNAVADGHGELTAAGNLAARVCGEEDRDRHKGCRWFFGLVDVRKAEAL
jgi:hypothetical protein